MLAFRLRADASAWQRNTLVIAFAFGRIAAAIKGEDGGALGAQLDSGTIRIAVYAAELAVGLSLILLAVLRSPRAPRAART